MFDLIRIWQNTLETKHQARKAALPAEEDYSPTIDEKFVQSSFEFKSSPDIIFVGSIESRQPVATYDQLPTLKLNPADQDAIKNRIEILSKNPKFYDGNQMLISGVYFDQEQNKLYLEAIQVKYSFINTLQTGNFPKNSPIYQQTFYKTGVIAPFVTQDEHVFVMERKDRFKLYSAASGFTEPFGEEKQLNPAHENLVVHTAKTEAVEEFLGLASKPHTSRLTMGHPQIASLSFRETENGIGTIEFIAPIPLKCDAEQLSKVLSTNEAKDKDEHTGQVAAIPLDPALRDLAVTFLQQKKPGTFLYEPIILSLSRFVNQHYYWYQDAKPSFLPNSRTQAIQIEQLTSKISRTLTIGWEQSQAADESSPKDQKDNSSVKKSLIQNRI